MSDVLVKEMSKFIAPIRIGKLTDDEIYAYCVAVHQAGLTRNFSQAGRELQFTAANLGMRMRVLQAEGKFTDSGVRITNTTSGWVIS